MMADFLDWLFSLRREDVLWGLAAAGLIVQGLVVDHLYRKFDRLRADLEQRGVL